MSKIFLSIAIASLMGGCRQDMHDQPRYRPLQESSLFADGRSARPLPEGTVPRGRPLDAGDPIAATTLPMPLDKALLQRGRERYDIFCSPCHSYVGDGYGMIVQRGLSKPPSYHTDRLRTAPVGHFYDVITNGYGAMYGYASRIPVRDRWAIAAYVRALQLSQNSTQAEVPAGVALPAALSESKSTEIEFGNKPALPSAKQPVLRGAR